MARVSQCLRDDVPVFGFKEPAGSEKQEQTILFGEISKYAQHLDLLNFIFHTPNGERRARKTANDLQKMGVRPGVWDVVYGARPPKYRDVQAGWKWNGLAIELKVKYNTLEDPQERWMGWYHANGYYTAICYTWLWAWRLVCSYFNLSIFDWKEGVSDGQLELFPFSGR